MEILTEEKAELHLFDVSTCAFVLQDANCVATVSEVGKWECKLGDQFGGNMY